MPWNTYINIPLSKNVSGTTSHIMLRSYREDASNGAVVRVCLTIILDGNAATFIASAH